MSKAPGLPQVNVPNRVVVNGDEPYEAAPRKTETDKASKYERNLATERKKHVDAQQPVRWKEPKRIDTFADIEQSIG